ncbi:MAG: nucleotide pyrophosphohydrolase [Bacteroidales bacterium]|nr:nucleotide pyrophosphohydrolase [Bacteroidales bacterium]
MDNHTLTSLTKKVLKFRDDRNWAQFHTGKDIAMDLSVEAAEVLELFLWKADDAVNIKKLTDELGDVFYALLLLADHFQIDLEAALINKLKKNEQKYPVMKFRDSNRKYNE